MARAPGDHHAASVGQKTMTRTVQCPECGVVLNLPDSAEGRKLKCPKCATKFLATFAGPADSIIAEASPASTMFPTRKGPPSSGDFETLSRTGSSGSVELPTSGRRGSGSSGSVELPTSGRQGSGSSGGIDLPSSLASSGDTYELPLPNFDDLAPSKGPAKASASADALALFQDEPKVNRKPKGAEARSKARRCPSCTGVVPVGMSLCTTCGLDLDTGKRLAPVDLFDEEVTVAPRQEVPPLGVLFVGSLSALTNLLLAIVCLATSGTHGSGMLCLMVVWLFGLYASVQFLRRKSIRTLVLALGLGAAIGAVYLIALPIWYANFGNGEVAPALLDPLDHDAPPIRNLAENLNLSRIYTGISVLLGYAALSIYLNSPSIKRQFHKK